MELLQLLENYDFKCLLYENRFAKEGSVFPVLVRYGIIKLCASVEFLFSFMLNFLSGHRNKR